jgi:hypothetical protein
LQQKGDVEMSSCHDTSIRFLLGHWPFCRCMVKYS